MAFYFSDTYIENLLYCLLNIISKEKDFHLHVDVASARSNYNCGSAECKGFAKAKIHINVARTY